MNITLKKYLRPRRLLISSGLTLVCSTLLASAQDYVIDNFDADPGSAWNKWWGSADQTYEFDPTVDANGNSNSGSLKATIGFDLATFAGDNQFAVLRNFPNGDILDGTKYTNLVFDVRWDPNSPKTANNDFGYLEYGFRNQDYSQTGLGATNVPLSATNWLHIVAPIDPTAAKLGTVAGVYLKIWSGAAGGLTGTTTFWVDNVKLIANTNTVAAPPKLALEPAVPGLQLSASASGQQYQRQSIRTLATDTDGNALSRSWLGSTQPVTYSFTVSGYPDAAHSGYQTHIFLAPEGANMPYGADDTSLDWNASNVIFLQLVNNSDGTATWAFGYKTNEPSGNTMIFNADASKGPVGRLAAISDASAKGTWSVSFKNDTNITLTTPSGTSTNFTMPQEAAALFADPLDVYFGTQPNNSGNIGQSAHLSRIQITGLPAPVDDSFSGSTLDTTTWKIVAFDPTGVQQVAPDAAYWLKWTAPATGFGVQSSSTLKPGSWTDPGLTNVVQLGSQKAVVVPKAALPAPNAGFFRLTKPQ